MDLDSGYEHFHQKYGTYVQLFAAHDENIETTQYNVFFLQKQKTEEYKLLLFFKPKICVQQIKHDVF